MSYLMKTYPPASFEPARGSGPYLFNSDGECYIDLISGVGVNGLGHAHPELVAAISDQASQMIHCSNLYTITLQEQLAEKLVRLAGASRAFFCNSGCEANEAAIKIARRYAYTRGIHNPKIIVANGSFHGRTLATMAATSNPKVSEGFGKLIDDFYFVPYDDVDAISDASNLLGGEVVAVMLEPIQGEGGVHVPSSGYLSRVRELCDQRGWLLIFDEVQCGIARTGRWFAHQHSQIAPDVMTLAKGLGSGVPIGACVAWGKASEIFSPGTHGSTFGGNPLASRCGIATLDIIQKENLMTKATNLGNQMRSHLLNSLTGTSCVKRVSGLGLMLGIELDRPCSELVDQALDLKLLINVTNQNVIRLLPPLVITDEVALNSLDKIIKLIKSF